MGISFQEYINIIRLDKATSLLITTNETITDIALKCGFPVPIILINYSKKITISLLQNIGKKNFIESSINEKKWTRIKLRVRHIWM